MRIELHNTPEMKMLILKLARSCLSNSFQSLLQFFEAVRLDKMISENNFLLAIV